MSDKRKSNRDDANPDAGHTAGDEQLRNLERQRDQIIADWIRNATAATVTSAGTLRLLAEVDAKIRDLRSRLARRRTE
jgi:hypothetical protein